MRKFKFKIQGSQYDVNILNLEDNIAEVEVNGTKYEVEVDKQLKTTKTPTLVRSKVEPSTEHDKTTAKTASPSERKGTGNIKSPLPGTIISVHVKEGDNIKIGDKLITLEAMKMENNVSADKEGTILSIKVKPGDSVMEGDLLIQIG
jgi:glutaconyl-CoA/methylmalonyl-CoA decarboxylase subunit gamma